jgi:hypothetical protein
MEAIKVGIREFREKLATYVLESDAPLAITRHGDTIGYFLPTRRKRTEAERAAFDKSHAELQEQMRAVGVTEDEILTAFENLRKGRAL